MNIYALLLAVVASAVAADDVHLFVDEAGTVHMPAMTVPFSSFASPEAKAAFLKRQELNRRYEKMGTLTAVQLRQVEAEYFKPALAQVSTMYATERTVATVGGVKVEVFTPREGVTPQNRSRVLVNLHGGGFTTGAGVQSALESIPLAGIEKIKVVSVDYRQGPENHFPAASEDVAAVYTELLKSYKPKNIGIYGCSAGGVLTAEAVVWFQRKHLPAPGAIGIFCASAAGWTGGDSGTLALPLSGFAVPPGLDAPPHPQLNNAAYFKDADTSDPLVLPIGSPEALAQFPPTLFITATRDPAMSSAVYTHTRLTQLGVDAQLYVSEGLLHGFLATDPDLPESKEAWQTAARFFDNHLAR